MSAAAIAIRAGTIVMSAGRRYQITHVLGLESVLAKDLESQKLDRLRTDQLRLPTDDKAPIESKPRDLSDFSKEEWEEAQERFSIIEPLLREQFRTRDMVAKVAAKADLNTATIYEWLKAYNQSGLVTSLVPRKPGRKSGSRLLNEAVEKLVESTIQDCYLSKQRLRPQDVVEEVKIRCRTAGIDPPHPNTVRNRIRELPMDVVLRRRGMRDEARNQFEPIRGAFPGANFPLAVVQIDHTEVNLIVVEEQTRLPMGRPWITLAIDVCTRLVVGCYITMEAPSATSVGMCLSNGMLPKREYLVENDIPGEWPVWGFPKAVHADNGPEFGGAMLQRAADEYNLGLEWRPLKRPHWGGHIERLMGTSAEEFRKLPGTTFSSPAERGSYDSEKMSAITLREFEKNFVDFIVNVYHRRMHSELGLPPLRSWELYLIGDEMRPGIGTPELPADPDKLRLDFLPFKTRTVQRYGLQIEGISYYDEVLNRWIGSTDPEQPKLQRKFIVRYDPRNMSRIWFYDPETTQYAEIPYRATHRPPVSLWELKEVRKRLREQGRQAVDEDVIFDAILRVRQRVEESIGKTKKARRASHRAKEAERHATVKGVPKASPGELPTKPKTVAVAMPISSGTSIEGDIFAALITPFDDRSVQH